VKQISIVIPLYNEEETIPFLHKRLQESLKKDFAQFNWQIIFIDDGSFDNTAFLMQELVASYQEYQLIQFSRNFGHHIAVTAGLDHATGDFVVVMDGDLQDQPEEIVRLYNKLQNSSCDVVYGLRKEKKFGFIKKISSDIFIRIMRWFLSEKIEVNTSIFRIMTRQVTQEVCRLEEKQRYVLGIIGWVGFKHTYIEVVHGTRHYGETKYSFFKQVQLAVNALLSFSLSPLRFITGLGFLFTLCSFILGCIVIIRYFTFGLAVMGWASIIVSILFMGGIQLCVIGIIGEYVGRTYIEVKNRPLYVVRKYCGISKSFKKENRKFQQPSRAIHKSRTI
jgi:dolichol-phosphate mannosyltransferase